MSFKKVCIVNDILPNSGRAALVDGEQVALFRLSTEEGEKFFAIHNYCPFAEANVLSRGIVGSLQGKYVVASPIYKQHFDLETGVCLEDESVALPTWTVQVDGDAVLVGEKIKAAA